MKLRRRARHGSGLEPPSPDGEVPPPLMPPALPVDGECEGPVESWGETFCVPVDWPESLGTVEAALWPAGEITTVEGAGTEDPAALAAEERGRRGEAETAAITEWVEGSAECCRRTGNGLLAGLFPGDEDSLVRDVLRLQNRIGVKRQGMNIRKKLRADEKF